MQLARIQRLFFGMRTKYPLSTTLKKAGQSLAIAIMLIRIIWIRKFWRNAPICKETKIPFTMLPVTVLRLQLKITRSTFWIASTNTLFTRFGLPVTLTFSQTWKNHAGKRFGSNNVVITGKNAYLEAKNNRYWKNREALEWYIALKKTM